MIRDYSDYPDIISITICDFAIFGDPAPILIDYRDFTAKFNQPLEVTMAHSELETYSGQRM